MAGYGRMAVAGGSGMRAAPYQAYGNQREPCGFFMRTGTCKWGDQCKHEHAGASGMPTDGGSFNMSPAGMGMGKGKGKGGGVPGERSGEACGFFLKAGWCRFGQECRHEHIAGPDTPVGVIPDMGGMGGQRSGEHCGFFRTKGWCKWGDQCKHQHVADAGTPIGVIPPMSMSAPDMGGMVGGQSGEACGFFLTKGWCKWGEQCKHVHMVGPETPMGGMDMGGMQQQIQPQQYGGQQQQAFMGGMPQMSGGQSGEPCGFFMTKGWCKWGDQCKHVHVAGPGTQQIQPQQYGGQQPQAFMGGMPPMSAGQSGEPCGFFMTKGWCKWGDQCKHVHVSGPETPVGVVPGMAAAGRSAPGPSGERCQFFDRTQTCKWGDQCKHVHTPN